MIRNAGYFGGVTKFALSVLLTAIWLSASGSSLNLGASALAQEGKTAPAPSRPCEGSNCRQSGSAAPNPTPPSRPCEGSNCLRGAQPPDSQKPKTKEKIFRKTGEEGTIVGTVYFSGQPPVRHRIDMSPDAACVTRNRNLRQEEMIVTNGRLANVFLYIKTGSGVDDHSFEVPTSPVTLDQRGCRFSPRVLGIQTNQPLQILNSDPTAHNVHAQAKNNVEWNDSQSAGAKPLMKQFDRPEVMIRIRCNQHPWMSAYVGVLAHPFFAVSGLNGSYRIEGLPPGNYKIFAWHEHLGEQSFDITISPGETRRLDFSFHLTQSRQGY